MAQEKNNTSHISLNRLISETLSKNASHAAMTDMNTGFMLTYSELAGKMAVIRGKLRDIGVKKGDRVVICGRNRSCWAASFLAAITITWWIKTTQIYYLTALEIRNPK